MYDVSTMTKIIIPIIIIFVGYFTITFFSSMIYTPFVGFFTFRPCRSKKSEDGCLPVVMSSMASSTSLRRSKSFQTSVVLSSVWRVKQIETHGGVSIMNNEIALPLWNYKSAIVTYFVQTHPVFASSDIFIGIIILGLYQFAILIIYLTVNT